MKYRVLLAMPQGKFFGWLAHRPDGTWDFCSGFVVTIRYLLISVTMIAVCMALKSGFFKPFLRLNTN